jgi:c-di-GMP-binding flagellar brake protein YcgR
MLLSHSERIRRIQKRRFFRKMTHLPAVLESRNGSGRRVQTRLVDLSAGGAKVQAAGQVFTVGQAVGLTLYPESGQPISVEGKITRVANDSSSLSIAFDSISERVRERIVRMVFS